MRTKKSCRWCKKEIDMRGIKRHEDCCDMRPKAPSEAPKPEPKQEPQAQQAPASTPPPLKPEAEVIVIKSDYTDVPPMQTEGEVISTLAPTSATIQTPKADIFDFDAEDCANAYGAVVECGVLIFADKEASLPEERVKKRGEALHKIMVKYGLTMQYLDLVFFGLGVAGDVSFLMREINKQKPKQEKATTDNTNHEIVEQKQTPAIPDKPQSLLGAGAVRAP